MLVREKRSLTNPAAGSGNGLGIPERQESWDASIVIGQNIADALRIPFFFLRLDWTFYGGANGGFSLGILRGLLMPGELSEGSFHDYFPETRRLMNNAYRKMEAYALRNSFMSYFAVPADTMSILAGIVTDKGQGTPLDYVRVKLLPEGTVYVGDQYHNGFYMIDRIPPADHSLVFETPGYSPDTVHVSVAPGSLQFHDRQAELAGPPAVLNSSPYADDPAFPASQPIVLRFTKPMDTATVRSAFQISPYIPGSLSWTFNNTLLTFDPDSIVFPFHVTYTVAIGTSALAADGMQLDGNGDGIVGDAYSLSFTTAPVDVWPPATIHTTPQPLDTLPTPFDIVNLTFDEPIEPSSANLQTIAIQQVGGALQAREFQVWTYGGKSGVNVYPSRGIESGTSYRVFVSGVEDLAGNAIPIPSPPLWQFWVSPRAYSVEMIENFDTSLDNWPSPVADSVAMGILADSSSWSLRADMNPLILSVGGSAAALIYRWDSTAATALIRMVPTQSPTVFVAPGTRLQILVWGDGSNDEIRWSFTRSTPALPTGMSEYSPWTRIAWVGWHLFGTALDTDTTGSIISERDSLGSISSIALEIRKGPFEQSEKGQLLFDNLHIARDIVLSVPGTSNDMPEAYALRRNFPNPFNPTTTIEFYIPSDEEVRLTVWNALGQRVATLVDGRKTAGRYVEVFDASKYPSGIYIARLEGGRNTVSMKMVLLK